eukprot:gnl/Dysnectes_brevis/6953_a11237_233.p1 GENE.gnl/Dysnectes_brevis/6953_a11237_233~~gnl/Dysnectes_brevis/6953_a11237_233.p1  ORF type:complete len:243 (-),score=71.27 gnl/Dysnectes_brevis/6953_a11237_233:52-780(-)
MTHVSPFLAALVQEEYASDIAGPQAESVTISRARELAATHPSCILRVTVPSSDADEPSDDVLSLMGQDFLKRSHTTLQDFLPRYNEGGRGMFVYRVTDATTVTVGLVAACPASGLLSPIHREMPGVKFQARLVNRTGCDIDPVILQGSECPTASRLVEELQAIGCVPLAAVQRGRKTHEVLPIPEELVPRIIGLCEDLESRMVRGEYSAAAASLRGGDQLVVLFPTRVEKVLSGLVVRTLPN